MKDEYKTKDGLGDVYQAIAEGKCVCWGFRASCPQHRTTWTSTVSTSTSTAEGMIIEKIRARKSK